MAINPLDKIKNVQKGLECCIQPGMCPMCPYDARDHCNSTLLADTMQVIDALEEEVKKRTDKAARNIPDFIELTSLYDATSDGRMKKVVIRVENILLIHDAELGSLIRMRGVAREALFVRETIEEILNKIAKSNEKEE